MRPLWLLLAATASLVAACRTAAPAASSSPVGGASGLPAARLMETCWEAGTAPDARVDLTFFTDGGKLRQVSFETAGGASPAVGRCAREVALSYPWPPEGVPERLSRLFGFVEPAYAARE